mmetsp:Transcript_3285/g.4527  ORF Transcript_3285/g.4527 Transcript_3285/m.4527 type:complete len:82 (+) Transcript_3285:90-335(+)
MEDYTTIKNRRRRQRKVKKYSSNVKGKACVWCQTNRTPEWRKGPHGQPLCNACGLQYHLERRKNNMKRVKMSLFYLLNPPH